MLGKFQKIQEICNKMSIRIFKIDEEMPEIMEPKVGNPKNSNSRNWANLSQPWNLAFSEDEIFKLFFNHMSQKYQNEKSPILNGQKSPKRQIKSKVQNEEFRGTYLNPPFWEHPVEILLDLKTYPISTIYWATFG